MGAKVAATHPDYPSSPISSRLLEQYGCGPVKFAGSDTALYHQHLLFDNAISLAEATPRDRFEAFAHSVRDILSQRWILTESTYTRRNAKRVYYLSMEFLIGRSLASNVINLLVEPVVMDAVEREKIDW